MREADREDDPHLMLFRPHTATVRAPKPNARPDGAQNVPTYGPAANVRCLIHPEKQAAAWERFGVELSQPFVLYCLPGQAQMFPIGARVDMAGKTYAVRAPAVLFDGIGLADHAEVLLEEFSVAGSFYGSSDAGTDTDPVSEEATPY